MNAFEPAPGMLPALADARWLTPDRARAYGQIVSIGMLIFTLGLLALFLRGAWGNPNGLSYSYDFNAFWSGSRLAALGHAGLAYVPATLKAMEETNARPVPSGGLSPTPIPRSSCCCACRLRFCRIC